MMFEMQMFKKFVSTSQNFRNEFLIEIVNFTGNTLKENLQKGD